MHILVNLITSGWLLLLLMIGFTLYLGLFRPSWCGKMMALFGTKGGCENPFYYFKRWTWEEPPENWRSMFGQCILWTIVFAGLAAYFALTKPDPKPWPFIAVPALMSVHFLIFAIRILVKVRATKSSRQA